MTRVYIWLYKTTFVSQQSERVHPMRMPRNYKIHKWTSSLLSPQVDKFITKSTKWTKWDYLSPQVDEFNLENTKFTSGRIHY